LKNHERTKTLKSQNRLNQGWFCIDKKVNHDKNNQHS